MFTSISYFTSVLVLTEFILKHNCWFVYLMRKWMRFSDVTIRCLLLRFSCSIVLVVSVYRVKVVHMMETLNLNPSYCYILSLVIIFCIKFILLMNFICWCLVFWLYLYISLVLCCTTNFAASLDSVTSSSIRIVTQAKNWPLVRQVWKQDGNVSSKTGHWFVLRWSHLQVQWTTAHRSVWLKHGFSLMPTTVFANEIITRCNILCVVYSLLSQLDKSTPGHYISVHSHNMLGFLVWTGNMYAIW